MSDKSEPPNISQTRNEKEILAASVGVGNNLLRLAVLLQIYIFPFFVYWFYERNFNMFSTFTSSWHFLISSMIGVVGTIIYNANHNFFGTNTRNMEWWNVKMSLFMIPAWYGHGLFVNLNFYVKWFLCDFWWLLFVSPLWIAYFFSKRTADETYKKLVTTEDKNELREIIAKNL